MENITDADCKHMKRVWEDFRIKNCGEHDWYIQGDTLLLASVFKSFQSKFIWSSTFLSAPGSAWHACLKKIIRTGIGELRWHTTNGRKRHQELSVPYNTWICKSQQQVHKRLWKKQRIFTSHVLLCQQLMWIGNITKVASRWFQVEKKARLYLMKNSYKTMTKKATKDRCSRSMLLIPRIHATNSVICHSYLKEWRLISMKKSCVIYKTRKVMP